MRGSELVGLPMGAWELRARYARVAAAAATAHAPIDPDLYRLTYPPIQHCSQADLSASGAQRSASASNAERALHEQGSEARGRRGGGPVG
eukprot:783369-Rhodomonas_salina.3